MTTRVRDVLDNLHDLSFEPGYLEKLEVITEDLRACADSQLAVEPVLRFIEAHPNEDLGAPGPLVHFVEEFYRRGYEQFLLESITRRPTTLTVWMLNRLVNGSEGAEQRRYLAAMRAVESDERAAPDVRDLAQEFLSRLE